MPNAPPVPSSEPTIEVDLRVPALAAFLAWLWPGAGHFYQRRYAKGVLFMTCVLGAFFFGLSIGGGRVVYASFGPPLRDPVTIRQVLSKVFHRWHYYCQAGTGVPALPALVQRWRVSSGHEPFGEWMAPPDRVGEPELPESKDRLAVWNEKYHVLFELGTLYTMIAGLLNVLAIYDAYAGPVIAVPEEESPDQLPEGKA